MNSFQQVCPSCNALLELPIEADGKSALCPACDAEFVAGISLKPIQLVPRDYQRVSIETIWGDSQTVFQGRRRRFLMPFLIPTILVLVGFVAPFAYLNGLAVNSRRTALIASAILSPWFMLVLSYAIWFALKRSTKICDTGPQEDSEPTWSWRAQYVPELRSFLWVFINLVVTVVVAATLLAAWMAMIRIGSVVPSVGIAGLIYLGSSVVALTLIVLVTTRFWPVYPLAMTRRFGIRAIKESWAITKSNLLTSFFLGLTILFLLGLGFSIFGLGLFFAIPAAAMVSTVALRSIEGSRIAALEYSEY